MGYLVPISIYKILSIYCPNVGLSGDHGVRPCTKDIFSINK